MPSPKSATTIAATAPTAPKAAKDADDAKPGLKQDTAGAGSKSGGGAGGGGSSSHKPNSEENKNKTSWIELQLVYESNGLPVVGMPFEVTLPDGKTVSSGATDDKGVARVDHIDPGSCQISFPTLDKEAWENA